MPERASRDDAMFLNCDNAVAKMEVAMTSFVEGEIDFERYREWVAPRILTIPRLCQYPKFFPLHLRYPAWIDVENFDPREHIEHIQLPAPGSEDQLNKIASQRFHEKLDFQKPLWRMAIVNGLEGGRSAMILNIHHCICDAAAAMEIFKMLFDDPEGGWPEHVHLHRAEPGVKHKPPVPVRIMKSFASRESRSQMGLVWRYLKAPGPWFPFTQPLSGRVHFRWREFSLDRLQEIRRALGGTMTDVGLAALGGALDRYAARHGLDVTDKYFKVVLPENVRAADRYGEVGNDVSGIPILVPLGIRDPAERLRLVYEYTRTAKENRLGRFVYGALGGLLDLIRPFGARRLTQLLASPRWIRFARHFVSTPREHAIVTSVNSPRSLVQRIDGNVISRMVPYVPCGLSLGLMCALTAYRDQLLITLSGDEQNLPDLDVLMNDVEVVIGEMHAAALLSLPVEDDSMPAVVGK